MFYARNNEIDEKHDSTEGHCLVLDGTANLDYFDEEQVPRVKGLVELLNQYFGNKD